MPKGKQDTKNTGYKFDNIIYNVGAWYLHSNLPQRAMVEISNNGINNVLTTTGYIYYDINMTGTVSNKNITDASVGVLAVGDSQTLSLTADSYISIRASVVNLSCNIFESDDVHLDTNLDT